MKVTGILGSVAAVLMLSLPAAAQGPSGPPPAEHSERRMGDRVDPRQGVGHGPHTGRADHHGMARRGPMGRPIISMLLQHRDELGLSAAQVGSLERLRSDFMRERIRRHADQKIARLDLMSLLRPDPADPVKAVDMAQIESKIREIEKMRADMQVARIRTIEAGKAQLTPDQRAKLTALMAQHRARWHRGGPERPAPPRS